jgi:hypothetical protein
LAQHWKANRSVGIQGQLGGGAFSSVH